MDIKTIKKQIQSKRFSDRYFVFTGEEIEAQRIYINKIAEATGKPVRRIEQVSQAFNKRASVLNVSCVFVCRDDSEFWRTATPVENINELLGNNILILQMTAIDKRSKSYKSYSSNIVEFVYMDADVLYKYLTQICPLSDSNAFALIDICENDYSRLLLETDKIKQYASATGVGVNEAFTTLIGDKAITRPPKDAIFDYVDAMLRADIGKAFDLLEECKGTGEPPLRVISVLYGNFRRVLQYQVCESRDVCATTGLTPYEVSLAKRTAGVWKSSDLVFFLRTLQRLEQSIKQGEVEEDKALDLLMVSIL